MEKLLKKIGAYVKEHTWGFSAYCVTIIFAASCIWLFGYNGFDNAFLQDVNDRNLWIWPEGYFWACVLSIIIFAETLRAETKQVVLFSFVIWLAFLTAQLWCCFFAIPYLLPIIGACAVHLCYRKINYARYEKEVAFFFSAFLFIVLGIAVTFLSNSSYEKYKKEQLFEEKALKNNEIELLDVKENFILTKEFGLEKVNKNVENDFKKGDMVHRIPFEDGEVIIVKK